MPKPTLVATTSDAPPTAPLADLPSQHIQHSAVYEHETQTRMSVFDAKIIALTTEIDGQQATFESDVEKLKIEFERATAALTAEHNDKKAVLLRQMDDMQTAKAMAAAALDKWNELKGGEAK